MPGFLCFYAFVRGLAVSLCALSLPLSGVFRAVACGLASFGSFPILPTSFWLVSFGLASYFYPVRTYDFSLIAADAAAPLLFARLVTVLRRGFVAAGDLRPSFFPLPPPQLQSRLEGTLAELEAVKAALFQVGVYCAHTLVTGVT